MTIQNYETAAGRINKLRGAILAHAIPTEVLGITGQQEKMPKNKGDTIIFRRWLPFGGVDNRFVASGGDTAYINAHVTQEGVTPTAETLAPVDVTAVLSEYSALYALSNKTADLHEDDIASPMKRQVGQRLGLVREMVRYGALKGCTNRYYSGGTTRETVSARVTLNLLRNISRGLRTNHAGLITSILAPSPNYETRAVEAGYLVFGHTDMEADIRSLPGFTPVAEYGSRQPIHATECGSVENFRFLLSPELVSVPDVGAAVGSLGLYSTTLTLIDVYPMLVVGEDAWGQVALRGADSIDPTYLPPNTKDKNDPLGQRGYIGAKTWFTSTVLNNGWMAYAEVGVSKLT